MIGDSPHGARWSGRAFALVLLLLAAPPLACSKADLLAPSRSTITLTATSTTLPLDGTATITALAVNADGQPVPDGTIITFATTLGSLQPSDAATAGGKATARFLAGATSGTASISAKSGTVAVNDAVTIAIGTAAVARLTVGASPTIVPFGGGSSTITATVVDSKGDPLSVIPISFATTAGTVSPTLIKTDADGAAKVTLVTSQAATVTATVGDSGTSGGGTGGAPRFTGSASVGIAARPQPVVTVMPSANPVARAPVTFTIGVAPAAMSGTTIQSVTVTFGDGTRLDLGPASGAALIVQHVYQSSGTYTAAVTAVDSNGGTATVATVIVVAPQAPLSVTIASAPQPGASITIYTFTAVVQPATVVIETYEWTFGDGSSAQVTTANQATHSFRNGGGPYTITVTVTSTPSGQTATGSTIINP